MMFDGVIPLGEALRPLGLSGPFTRTWRQRVFGSRPRRICVTRGFARTGSSCGCQCLLTELAQRVVGALEQLARDRQARAVTADPLLGL